MIEHKNDDPQVGNMFFTENIPEEIKGNRNAVLDWQEQESQRYQARIAAQNAILDPIRARLAAGTVTTARLQIVTGLDTHQLKDLLEGRPLSTWGNVDDESIAALADWLKEADRPPEDDAAYAVTPTFQSLQNLLATAHQDRLLLAITGTWGIGKTQAAQYYAASHPRTHTRPGAVRIQFDSTDCKPVAALEKIRDAMGANPGSHRRGNVMNAIGAALRPGDFLILEECQRLGEALDVICSLHDDFGVGIAMIGNPDLSAAVFGKKTTFGALASRACRFDFPATTPEDVEAWLAWHGLPEGLNGTQRNNLAKAVTAQAIRPGRNGGLRAAADIMRIAQSLFPGQTMTGELFTTLASQFKPSAQ
ncbi:AAA family ATPase [Dechloromonas denitrificans]|uniref:AAA family ATPase n=1 Tax=Dechloromonas denitrificans TaxID=281362 RepID=UPI001CFAD13E|nr:AAA family ATPase [Dechloromonas denitrificans]UCV08475.1 AAA family ATPase [Dechloromonas denitrificans]